ncbi:hypothetical protein PS685_04863 [Pseudomonas fluorescens]|uniref:Uncharacterized protein n=1 Tax=Pseudomonas fluorescens TaxID=294 RepID=A0A5E6ZQQ4_PSEFL|nr:hypothetical protein PS685_04863 [Pseudomonas fluorescens]
MGFEDLVFFTYFIDKLQHIGKTGTARGANTQTNPLTFAAPIKGAANMSRSRFCHADSHRDSLPFASFFTLPAPLAGASSTDQIKPFFCL